jgi:hypothetical protein
VRPWRAAALAGLAACASAGAPSSQDAGAGSLSPPPVAAPGAPPVPAGAAPIDPRDRFVTFGPAALRYVVQQHVRMDYDRPDMPPTSQLGWRTYVSSTVSGPADTAGYPAIFAIDSIVTDSGVVLPPWIDLRLARGLRFVGHLAPTGEFRLRHVSDSSAADNLAILIGSFRHFYPRLPPGGVRAGDTWTDTLTQVDRGGGRTSTRMLIRNSAAGAWEDGEHGRVLRVEVSEGYDLTERGGGAGQEFEASGSGVTTSVERIGAGGRYLGAEARDSATLVITLKAQGITVPRRQITFVTVRVLP